MDRFNARGMLGDCFNQIVEIPIQSLHQQHRELAVREETHTHEQRDVGVTKVRHQLAFLHVLANNIFHSSISSINENVMDFLSSTYQPVYFNLKVNTQVKRLQFSIGS